MAERTMSSGSDMIMFLAIIAVILIIFSIIAVRSAEVGQKAGIAGAPGVVVSEKPTLEYADENGVRYYLLKILKVEHEEGKVMDIVPVINVYDFVYRPSGSNKDYPVFSIPGDIEAVFENIANIDIDSNGNDIENIDGIKVHVSLWEARCLEDIGFVTNNAANINDISYSTLVRKCSNAYLIAYDVELKKYVEEEKKP